MPEKDLPTRLNEASSNPALQELARDIAGDALYVLGELFEASRSSSGRTAPTSHAVLRHLGRSP